MSKSSVVNSFLRSKSSAIESEIVGLVRGAEAALRRAGLNTSGAEQLVRERLAEAVAEDQEPEEQDVEITFSGTWTVKAKTDAEIDAKIDQLTEAARSFGITDIEADAPAIDE